MDALGYRLRWEMHRLVAAEGVVKLLGSSEPETVSAVLVAQA